MYKLMQMMSGTKESITISWIEFNLKIFSEIVLFETVNELHKRKNLIW